MKKITHYATLLLIISTLQGCWYFGEIGEEIPVSKYKPVIMNRTNFENATALEEPQDIINSGKIYIKDEYLFVGEKNQGFHIFNNTDPENPIKIAFLRVLGASDIAIKGDVFYINNAIDLIAVKPNLTEVTIDITKRVENIFPQLTSPDGFNYYDLKDDEIIVDWTLK